MKPQYYSTSFGRLPNSFRNLLSLIAFSLVFLIIFCFPNIGYSESSNISSSKDNYVIIKFMDSSEKTLYNWSFLYRWADYDKEPPEGYTWSADTEKPSDMLFLKKVSDGTKIQINSNEIIKFEMSWQKKENVEGWLDRKSLTIVKTNGERIVLPSPFLSYEYYVDKSELTQKRWAQEGTAYLYIIGNEDKKPQSDIIKFPLFYDNSVLYKQNNFSVPIEIMFVRN